MGMVLDDITVILSPTPNQPRSILDRFGIETPVKPRDSFGLSSAPTAHSVFAAILLASCAALVQLKFAASLC